MNIGLKNTEAVILLLCYGAFVSLIPVASVFCTFICWYLSTLTELIFHFWVKADKTFLALKAENLQKFSWLHYFILHSFTEDISTFIHSLFNDSWNHCQHTSGKGLFENLPGRAATKLILNYGEQPCFL